MFFKTELALRHGDRFGWYQTSISYPKWQWEVYWWISFFRGDRLTSEHKLGVVLNAFYINCTPFKNVSILMWSTWYFGNVVINRFDRKAWINSEIDFFLWRGVVSIGWLILKKETPKTALHTNDFTIMVNRQELDGKWLWTYWRLVMEWYLILLLTTHQKTWLSTSRLNLI